MKLCNKHFLLLGISLAKYILNRLLKQETKKKITNLREVIASYRPKRNIVLRITKGQLISRFMFVYKQGFFFFRSLYLRCYMIWAITDGLRAIFHPYDGRRQRLLVHRLINRK